MLSVAVRGSTDATAVLLAGFICHAFCPNMRLRVTPPHPTKVLHSIEGACVSCGKARRNHGHRAQQSTARTPC